MCFGVSGVSEFKLNLGFLVSDRSISLFLFLAARLTAAIRSSTSELRSFVFGRILPCLMVFSFGLASSLDVTAKYFVILQMVGF